MLTFGEIVRCARRARVLSIEKLAKAVGSTKGHLSSIESGKHAPPRPPTVRKIARALGLDPLRLLAYRQLSDMPKGLSIMEVRAAIDEIVQRERQAEAARFKAAGPTGAIYPKKEAYI